MPVRERRVKVDFGQGSTSPVKANEPFKESEENNSTEEL